MKKLRFTFTLCFLFAILALPVSAKGTSAPRKMTLSRKEVLLYVGESKKLSVQKTVPTDASSKVTWTSKNQKIASVSKYGKLSAKKQGKTIVTAVSKKNASVKSSIRVIVRKRPARKVKSCAVTGTIFGYNSLSSALQSFSTLQLYSSGRPVIRSEEDLKELKKNLIKHQWARNTVSCLAQYKNTDFTKESLVLLKYFTAPYSGNGTFVSFDVALDSSGKLCGTAHLTEPASSPDSSLAFPAVLISNTLVLQMKKTDEAMIDYFKVDLQIEK